MLPRTLSMCCAYGRAASAAAWARRNFDAATICMALVIFCVALVAAMRLRRSFSEGIALLFAPSCPALSRASTCSSVHVQDVDGRVKPGHDDRGSSEGSGVFVDRALELAGRGVIEVARAADRLENVRVLRADRGQEPLFEGAHPVHLNRIEIAVDAGVDD